MTSDIGQIRALDIADLPFWMKQSRLLSKNATKDAMGSRSWNIRGRDTLFMLKGPKGEKRPGDVIGAAIKVAKIATGEVEEEADDGGKNKAAVELGRKGGKARASKLTAEQREEIARVAAQTRWRKSDD